MAQDYVEVASLDWVSYTPPVDGSIVTLQARHKPVLVHIGTSTPTHTQHPGFVLWTEAPPQSWQLKTGEKVWYRIYNYPAVLTIWS